MLATTPGPATGWRRKACTACTSSKRQCSKQTPACRRCLDKGIVCQYPLVRRVCAPLLPILGGDALKDAGPVSEILTEVDTPNLFDFGLSVQWIDQNQEQENGCDGDDILMPATGLVAAESQWFLAKDTWEVEYSQLRQPEAVDSSVLQYFVDDVQRWLRQWVSDGQNPFIHRQLYRQRMPRAIQDAYTTLTAYLARNSKNSDLTFQIIGDRAVQLLEPSASVLEGPAPDTLEQLARVQALLIYQTVRLFDGDIRARAQGELAIHVLLQWVQQLWETARLDLGSTAHGNTAMHLHALGIDASVLAWRLWIIAESVRRTWLTAKTLMAVYITTRDGWSECPGGLCFTARKGMWDALSATAWSKASEDPGPPRFLQSMAMDSLVDTARADDVDGFGRTLMKVAFGPEKMEQWYAGTTRGASGASFDSLFLDVDGEAGD